MKNIIVREVYTVDTISKTNNKAWEILAALLTEDTDYMFDFKGIELVDPWLNDAFNKFINDSRVHMQLYSSEKTAYTINTMCVLGGMKSGRVFNTDIVAPKAMTADEKRVIAMAKQLQDYFVVNDENKTALFNVYKRFDQLGSVQTIDFIEAAIRTFDKEHFGYSITMDLASIFIQKNILELLSNKLDEMLSEGIALSIISQDKEVNDKIDLHRHISNNREYTLEDKAEMFKGIKPGTVGMISKYRSSRGTDEFGRHGNGEVVSCRVAIFRGVERVGFNGGVEDIKPVFDVYNGDKFYTMQHWMLENDSEELDKLDCSRVTPAINEVGLYGEFLGSKYHFMEPIQYDESGYSIMYSVDENGRLVTEKLSIPERIKRVLKDWGIEHDKEKLEYCIEETNKILNN